MAGSSGAYEGLRTFSVPRAKFMPSLISAGVRASRKEGHSQLLWNGSSDCGQSRDRVLVLAQGVTGTPGRLMCPGILAATATGCHSWCNWNEGDDRHQCYQGCVSHAVIILTCTVWGCWATVAGLGLPDHGAKWVPLPGDPSPVKTDGGEDSSMPLWQNLTASQPSCTQLQHQVH